MQNYSGNIEFFTRKLAGELHSEELQSFAEWLAASPENAAEFAEFESIWNGVDSIKHVTRFDTEVAWYRLQKVITEKQTVKKSFRPLFAAAVIIGVLCMSWFSYKLFFTKSAELITVTTAMHNTTDVVLPDSSMVSLYQNSSVSYQPTFETERRIQLQGNAFFDVTHNPQKPFVVEINQVRVQVLGTSFFISHDTISGLISIIVKTGKVAVFTYGKADTAYVTAGERVDVLQAKKLTKSVNTQVNYMSWKTKVFDFKDVPLKTIVAEINAAYFTNIQIQGDELKNCKIHVSFQNKTIDEILEILQVTLDITIHKSTDLIVISGNGC